MFMHLYQMRIWLGLISFRKCQKNIVTELKFSKKNKNKYAVRLTKINLKLPNKLKK